MVVCSVDMGTVDWAGDPFTSITLTGRHTMKRKASCSFPLLLALALALAACNKTPVHPDASAPDARYDQTPVCVEDGRGGHTMGGGNYAPGPCP